MTRAMRRGPAAEGSRVSPGEAARRRGRAAAETRRLLAAGARRAGAGWACHLPDHLLGDALLPRRAASTTPMPPASSAGGTTTTCSSDARFWQSIRLTLLWAVVVVSIQMVLGFFAGGPARPQDAGGRASAHAHHRPGLHLADRHGPDLALHLRAGLGPRQLAPRQHRTGAATRGCRARRPRSAR